MRDVLGYAREPMPLGTEVDAWFHASHEGTPGRGSEPEDLDLPEARDGADRSRNVIVFHPATQSLDSPDVESSHRPAVELMVMDADSVGGVNAFLRDIFPSLASWSLGIDTTGQGPVLVVDDDEEIRDFVGMVLADEGYEVVSASHGAAALHLTEQRPPSVILLDMRMPIMDGWTFARAYRQRPGPHAPIIVVTAAREAADRAAQIQAEGFLAKPFGLDELLGLVGRYSGRE